MKQFISLFSFVLFGLVALPAQADEWTRLICSINSGGKVTEQRVIWFSDVRATSKIREKRHSIMMDVCRHGSTNKCSVTSTQVTIERNLPKSVIQRTIIDRRFGFFAQFHFDGKRYLKSGNYIGHKHSAGVLSTWSNYALIDKQDGTCDSYEPPPMKF